MSAGSLIKNPTHHWDLSILNESDIGQTNLYYSAAKLIDWISNCHYITRIRDWKLPSNDNMCLDLIPYLQAPNVQAEHGEQQDQHEAVVVERAVHGEWAEEAAERRSQDHSRVQCRHSNSNLRSLRAQCPLSRYSDWRVQGKQRGWPAFFHLAA